MLFFVPFVSFVVPLPGTSPQPTPAIKFTAMLTPIYSRQRQKRLLDLMEKRKYDAIVIGAPQHVYYFSAHYTWWQHLSAFILYADGDSLLITANTPNKAAAANDVQCYEANAKGTIKDDQPYLIGRMITTAMRHKKVGKIGADASVVTSQVALGFDGPREQIDEDLFQMRRVKDPDEFDLIMKAVGASRAMYQKAREIIEPGIPELKVFGELHTAAVEAAGEPLSALLGNDFACGVPGGPARGDHVAQDGQMYILDLGPVVRGYFSDTARTICVNHKPTDAQESAYEDVLGCLAMVEGNAKAGTPCYHLWHWVNEYLKQCGREEMTHHLGHGVGLNPHEYPHLNPEWDDKLQEGEIFTAEPGLYGPEINGGIRIENMYKVTATGVLRLTDFPVGLV
jgi:Xaa-Pro dipeptidase